MNGYDLTNKMRKARRRHPLTATEQALYHELIAMCNDVEWADTFICSNKELCGSLDISEKTLITARQSLISLGLLYYKCGKSRRSLGTYSFVKELSNEEESTVETTGNITVVEPKKDATTEETTEGSTVKFPDYNNKDKLKQKVYTPFEKFQDWIVKHAPNVAKMREPFTEEQYWQVKEKFHSEAVKDVLKAMHNYKPLLQKNISAYLTLCNWLARRSSNGRHEKGKEAVSNSPPLSTLN